MRRIVALLSVVALLMVSMVMGISAQDATPPGEGMAMPDSFELAPGVVADNFLFAEGAMEPSSYRLTFDAGVTYAVAPSPNLEVAYQESGSLVMTLDAAVTVTELGDVASGGTVVPAGTGFTLETGHFVVLQPGVSGEVRNEGSEPGIVSVAGLTPAGGGAPVASPEGTPAG